MQLRVLHAGVCVSVASNALHPNALTLEEEVVLEIGVSSEVPRQVSAAVGAPAQHTLQAHAIAGRQRAIHQPSAGCFTVHTSKHAGMWRCCQCATATTRMTALARRGWGTGSSLGLIAQGVDVHLEPGLVHAVDGALALGNGLHTGSTASRQVGLPDYRMTTTAPTPGERANCVFVLATTGSNMQQQQWRRRQWRRRQRRRRGQLRQQQVAHRFVDVVQGGVGHQGVLPRADASNALALELRAEWWVQGGAK